MTDIDTPSDPRATILRFPQGIPGFPGERRFRLDEMVEDSAFQLFNSVDSGAVSMVVARPWLFFPDYQPVISDEDQHELELERADDAIVLCSVSIDAGNGRLYLNLRGPFVINGRTLKGRQVLLDDDLPLRAAVELESD